MFLMYDLVPSLLLYDLVPAEVASYPPLQNTFHLKVKICLKDTKRRIKTSFNLFLRQFCFVLTICLQEIEAKNCQFPWRALHKLLCADFSSIYY